jgi:hypothetical protein
MTRDFYIHYSIASQFDGRGYRLLKEKPRERVDGLIALLNKLLLNETDPGEHHTCPVCGQILKVSLEIYKELPDELDISSVCEKCKVNVFFKSNKIPSWARSTSIFDLLGFID